MTATVLLKLLQSLIAGQGVGALTSVLSASDWIEIGLSVAASLPEAEKLYAKLHPALQVWLDALVAHLDAGKDEEAATAGAHGALADWIKADAQAAIDVEQSMEERHPA